MGMSKYYIVELIEDVCNPWNIDEYSKGRKIMVWEDTNLDCYWTVNSNDNFKTNCAKKLHEFVNKKI